MKRRFVITMIGRDGNRCLAFANHAHNHFDTRAAGEALLTQLLASSDTDNLKEAYGDYTKLRVQPVPCFDHGEAMATVFGQTAYWLPEEMPQGEDWIITHDYITDDASEPRLLIADDYNRLKQEYPHRFKLYDGDGELYYEGLSKDDSSFEPLDEYATPNDGCISIHYYNEKTQKWEEL